MKKTLLPAAALLLAAAACTDAPTAPVLPDATLAPASAVAPVVPDTTHVLTTGYFGSGNRQTPKSDDPDVHTLGG